MLNRQLEISHRALALVFALFFMAGAALDMSAQKKNNKNNTDEGITSRYYSSRAENFEKAGSWDAAKNEIDRGLEKYPDDPDLRYLNGRYYYYAEGDFNKARYNLIKAIQEDDQNYGAKRLMVDLEDSVKHYSSAICYINELLEFEPYDRDMWRRKIGLYKKIGHQTEADEALERLARIYPNDSIVRRDLSNRNRESWATVLSNTPYHERAQTLESWIEIDKNNLEYYLELVDIYHALGEYERALGVANRGLRIFANNGELVRRAIGIMTEMGLYTRALAFAREHRMTGQIYNNLLREVAADARLHDPYEVNGRLYLTTGDADALTYLLNTSLTRGYYDDALVYLQESYRKYGRTPDLLLKEYALEKRFGDEKGVMRVLRQISEADIKIPAMEQEYAALLIELANREIDNEDYYDALEHLTLALSLIKPDDEGWANAMARKISLLGRMNRLAEARREYYAAVALDSKNAPRFAAAYEEVAANRLRILIENENYSEALAEAEALLAIMPDSEAALRTCINMAQTLKKNDLFYSYAQAGYDAYPHLPYFIVKQALALSMQGKNDEALALLTPTSDDDYVNPQLSAAYVGISQEWAELLLKERFPEQAMEKIDQALMFDPSNKDLLYMKGLAYEQLKDFPQAYNYQHKYYNPSNAEQAEWYEHMRYLHLRSFRHHVDASYTTAFYDSRAEDFVSRGHLFSIASVAYSYLDKKDTYMGQISYKGVDGDLTQTGGIGLEFLAQWDHTFNSRWSMMGNASYGIKYFNKIGLNLQGTYNFDRGWSGALRLGYRLTPHDYLYINKNSQRRSTFNLFILTPKATKSWERINTSLGVDVVFMAENPILRRQKALYYNVNWQGKLFFNEDNISSVSLLAGFGSFPELSFFDQLALRRFSHTNAMVGFDVQYLFTSRFYMGLTGTWNTCFNPIATETGFVDAYRNIYSITLQAHLAF